MSMYAHMTRNEVAAVSTLKAIMAFNYNPIMGNGKLCMQRFFIFVGFYAA